MGNISKILEVVGNEVGYLEKASNAMLESKTANAGKNNYTKYGFTQGCNGQPWCDAFIDYCFIEAFGRDKAKQLLGGFSNYTPTSAQYFRNMKRWHQYPKVGDIIFFKNSQRICHTGIIYKIDNAKIYTIEGNTNGGSTLEPNGGAVAKKSYSLVYNRIAGYGRPDYKDNSIPPVLPSSNIKRGKKGVQAAFLQQCLNYVGYMLEEDGDFGPKSEAALKDFQSKHKLVVDGEYGPKTRAAMEKEMN